MDIAEHQIEAAERNVALQTDAAIAGIRATLQGEGDEDCEDCGEPIGARRRAALPSATRCIGCQSTFEGTQRGIR